MTNKQKISALKKTRKVFDKIAKSKMNTHEIPFKFGYLGICDMTYSRFLTTKQRREFTGLYLEDVFRKYFKVPMPRNDHTFKWSITTKGYKARVRAIDKAIERLSK